MEKLRQTDEEHISLFESIRLKFVKVTIKYYLNFKVGLIKNSPLIFSCKIWAKPMKNILICSTQSDWNLWK
jgi:hypothetical protein